MPTILPPPATKKEYWDRVIELTEITNGQYTAEQAAETLGLTGEDMEDIEQDVYRYFRHPQADRTTALEMLDAMKEVWTSSSIARSYAEEKLSGFDATRREAFIDAEVAISRREREVHLKDMVGFESIYRLYLILLAGLKKAGQEERHHG